MMLFTDTISNRNRIVLAVARSVAIICKNRPNRIQKLIDATTIDELCLAADIPPDLTFAKSIEYLEQKYGPQVDAQRAHLHDAERIPNSEQKHEQKISPPNQTTRADGTRNGPNEESTDG